MTRWSAITRTRRSRSTLAYGSRSTATAETTSTGSYTTSGDATHEPTDFGAAKDVIPVGVRVDDRARARPARDHERVQECAGVRRRRARVEHEGPPFAQHRTEGRTVGRPRRHPVDVLRDLRERVHSRTPEYPAGATAPDSTPDPENRRRSGDIREL